MRALKERNGPPKVRFAGGNSTKLEAGMEAKLEAAMQRVKQDLLAELGAQNRGLVDRVNELEKENALLRQTKVLPPDGRVPFEQPRQAGDMGSGRVFASQVRPFRGKKGSATPDVPYEKSKFAQEVARMCAVILPDGVHSDSSSCVETTGSLSPSPESTASESSPGVPMPRRSQSLSNAAARAGSAEPLREHPVRVLTRGQSRQVLSSPQDAPLLFASLQRAVSQDERRTVSARSLRVRAPESCELVRAPCTDRPRLAREPLPSPPPPPPTPFMSPRETARLPLRAPCTSFGYPRLPCHAPLAAVRRPVVTRMR